MSDVTTTIDDAVVSILRQHKQTNGRRFSTEIEGYGHVKKHFDGAMYCIRTSAEIIDLMWSDILSENPSRDYAKALDNLCGYTKLAVEDLLSLIAMAEKLKGGVVHERKQSTETEE